ncbi:MAG: FHA domain-containing protein [Planctomycetaceae bacterium]|nr:FHA domain-containing protein [Planctomycetaceae bacterium]
MDGSEHEPVTSATLLVIQGIDQGTRFELGDSSSVGVGRGVRNEIRILDTEVSRQHARIQHSGGHWSVLDRNSSNGTFVNGVPVRNCDLHSGDRIQVGRTVLLFSRPVTDDESRLVADQVDLIGRHTLDDRSSIIDSVSQKEASPTLLHGMSQPESGAAASQTLANLQALYRIAEEAVTPSLSVEQLLRRILDLTIAVVGADRGCVLIDDPEATEFQSGVVSGGSLPGAARLVPLVFRVRADGDAQHPMPVSRSIVDYVLQNGQGVRTSDARSDSRFDTGQSILQAGIREAMCVPVQGHSVQMGVIYVDTTTPASQSLIEGETRSKFTEEQLRLLVAIGRQSALAIENSRYQNALLKAERLAAMGQTIAMLSHHIKNILQGVRGGSYLIDMGLGDHNEDLVRRGWGIVEKNQNKIYNLVMDMLTFSKERKPVMQEADVNETVKEVCELMQSRAEECGVRLEMQQAEDLPPTLYDAEGIHRGLLNVVTNAIDAAESREDAAVLVQTGFDETNDIVFVSVSDNGEGIPPEQLTKIFNIFESTKGARGTGLGLAVSQKILREHGGEITVESRPGQGSRFTLAWPRVDEDHSAIEGHTSV